MSLDRSEQQKWLNLLAWLQECGMKIDQENLLVEPHIFPESGRGLAVTRDVPSNQKLFSIPRQSLLNLDTLHQWAQDHTAQSLNAVQLLTLYLTVHKPESGRHPTKSPFLPYLEILPFDFDFHPVTWITKPKYTATPDNLLAILPPIVLQKLRNIQKRFKGDVLKMQAVMPDLSEIDLLWGWLIVNTRSLYYKCARAKLHQDNITLCPLLDLANHSLSAPNFNTSEHRRKGHPIPTMISPPDRGLHKGEEIFLLYGHHSNQDLFVEYGFIDPTSPKEICIDDAVFALFEKAEYGEEKKYLLQARGYWGDWTLHANPPPAHPSYRLIPALRLLVIPWKDTDQLRNWESMVSGVSDEVSTENTRMAQDVLNTICSRLHSDSLRALSALESCSYAVEEWQVNSAHFVQRLWEETRDVSLATGESIASGVVF